MPTKILLLRHGTHDWLGRVLCGRMPGVTLNGAGVTQAESLAKRLAGEAISAIYVSPLERTLETAAPLGALRGLETCVDPRLVELEFGAWTGVEFDTLHDDPTWRSWNVARSQHRPPGGENIQDVQERAIAWVAEMAKRHPDETIAAVSHGDVIKALVLHVLGAPVDAIHAFDIDPASVTRLEVAEDRLRLNSLNENRVLSTSAILKFVSAFQA